MTPLQFHWLMLVICSGFSLYAPTRVVAWGFAGLADLHSLFLTLCLIRAWKQAKERVLGTKPTVATPAGSAEP